MPPARALLAAVLAGTVAALAACSGRSPSSSGSATPSPVHGAAATDYLLRLDELGLAGFTVATPAQSRDVAALSDQDATLAAALGAAGVRSAASARYFRTVPVLATANGPIDVVTTAVACWTPAGATAAMAAFVKHLDAAKGAIPMSTGPLGDGGHGVLVEAVDQGVTVAQVTLVWRNADVVAVLVVRERDTGSPLADALVVARPQVTRLEG